MFRNTLRKAIASVSTTALLLSSVIVPGMGMNVAQAQTLPSWLVPFTDVATDLEVPNNAVSNPGGNPDRCDTAELYVYAHDAAVGVSDSEIADALASNPFTDTSGDCKVAAALMNSWGLMFGQGGTAENPSSTFGSNDVLNKNDQAVVAFRYDTGVLGNEALTSSNNVASLDSSLLAMTDLPFTDVSKTHYSYAAIVHLFAKGYIVGEGGSKGNPSNTFGNGTATNNAVLLVMAFRATEITDTDGADSGIALPVLLVLANYVDGGTGTPIVSGNLTVTKVSEIDKDVVADGAIVKLLKLRFSNGTNQTITVDRIDATARGIANDSQIDGAFLLPFTSDKRSSFADNKTTITGNFMVQPGSSVEYDVAFSIKSTFNSGTIGVEVTSVTSNASNTLGLPIVGKIVQVVDGASSIGSLTATALSEGSTTERAGEEFRAMKVQLVGGSNESLTLWSMLFDEVGSTDEDDIKSARLVNDSNGEELSMCGFVQGDISCELNDNAQSLAEGGIIQVVLMIAMDEKADVGGRTFQAQIKRDFHIVVSGDNSGSLILPTLNPGAPIGTDIQTMENGSMTLSKSSLNPTGNIQPGSTNSILAALKAEIFSETLLITDVQVDLSTGTTVAADFTGTVRVVAVDPGQDPLQEGESLVTIDATNADLHDGTPVFTSATNVRWTPGTTKILYIISSVATTATSGRTVTPNLNIQFETDNSGTVSTTGIVNGNSLVIQDSTVQVAADASFTSTNEVAGTSGVTLGIISFKGDSSEANKLNTISVNLSSVTGLTNLRAVRLDMEGTPSFGTARGTVALAGNTFSGNGDVTIIDAGETARIALLADTTTAATTTTLSVPANGISFTGSISSTTRTLPLALFSMPAVTVVQVEQLKVTTITQPTKGVVYAGQKDVLLSKVKVEARDGAVVMEEMFFSVFQGAGNFKNFSLRKSDGTVMMSGVSIINNGVRFPVNILTEKNLEQTFSVYGDVTDSGTAISQQNFSMALSGIEYTGEGSGSAGVPSSSKGEVLTGLATTSAEIALQANETLLVRDSGAGTEDAIALATAFHDYDADYTASPTLNGAVTSIANGTRISTFPYDNSSLNSNRLVVAAATTGLANEDFVQGELVFVYDADTAANTGIGVVTTAAANLVAGGNLVVWLQGDATATTVTVATGDVIAHLATPVAYTAAPTPATLSISVTAGQIAFFGDADTAANSGLTVITDTVAGGADGSAAGAVINGITLAVGDTITVYASQQAEAPSATAVFSYNAGSIVVLANAATPANSGLHIANATRIAGESLLTAGALISGATLTANDYVAVLNGAPISGEPKQIQDTFPITTSNEAGLGALVTGNEQLLAKLKITNPGPRELIILGFRVTCTGSVVDVNVQDNAFRVERNGSTTLSITRSDAGAPNCTTTPTITFNTPETVGPNGGSIEIWVYLNTAGSLTGANKFIQLEFPQTAGVVGAAAVDYAYSQGSGGTGTNPTIGSPARISNDSKISGKSFES